VKPQVQTPVLPKRKKKARYNRKLQINIYDEQICKNYQQNTTESKRL
jgi:hypothetical protein